MCVCCVHIYNHIIPFVHRRSEEVIQSHTLSLSLITLSLSLSEKVYQVVKGSYDSGTYRGKESK